MIAVHTSWIQSGWLGIKYQFGVHFEFGPGHMVMIMLELLYKFLFLTVAGDSSEGIAWHIQSLQTKAAKELKQTKLVGPRMVGLTLLTILPLTLTWGMSIIIKHLKGRSKF